MGKEDLINAIKSIPSSGNIYFKNVGLTKVYYNNSLIWAKKNTSVITWSDTLTLSPGPNAAVNYSGNRNSNNCSGNCYTSSYFGQQSYASQSIASITVSGKIWEGTKHLNINMSSSRWNNGGSGMPDFGRPNPTYYFYIYAADGTVVASLGNGNHDVSAYNNGSYYFKGYCGDGYYAASTHGAGASASISLTPY